MTIVSALFALAANGTNNRYVLIAYFPSLIFWILDGYFLAKERQFRDLYDVIRCKGENEIDFSMKCLVSNSKKNDWFCVTFSKTLLLFHGSILISILTVMFLIN